MPVVDGGGSSGNTAPRRNLTMQEKLAVLNREHEANVRKLKQKLSGKQLEQNLQKLNKELKADIAAVKRAFTKRPETNPGGVTRGGDPRKARVAEQAEKQEKKGGGAPTRGGNPRAASAAPKKSPVKIPSQPGHAGHNHEHDVKPRPAARPGSGGLPPDSVIWERLSRLIADAPGQITITSGKRDPKRQQQLWEEALRKYGDPEIADNWVARPGNSQHEHGNASDLKFASAAVKAWVHKNAYRYGLSFPLSNEPWHIEVVEARGGQLHQEALARGVVPGVVQGRQVVRGGGKAAPAPALPPAQQQRPAVAGGAGGGAGTGQGVTTQDMLGSNRPVVPLPAGEKKTADDFGFAASFFNSDPELKSLLQKAIAGGWEAEKFAVEFQKTKWYGKHSASAREWIALNHNDPASARRRVEVAAADITRLAREMGSDVTGLEAHDMAVNFLKEGWSQQELNKRVAGHVEFKRGVDFSGQAGANQDQIRQKSAAYGLNLSEDQIARWVRDIALGVKGDEDLDNWIKAQAKILYPSLGAQIDQGLTVEDVAGIYRNQMAQVLEINEADIDITKDPTIKKALSYRDPNAKAENTTVIPLWKFEEELRKDPRWLQTNNARDQLMGAGGEVLRQWGFKF